MSGGTGDLVRYRAVLANREFQSLYAAQALSLLGDQLARIALAILVYERTDSALGATATYAVSYLTYLVGGSLLAGLSDRHPRLTVMVACDLLRAPLVLLLCLQDAPLWVVFVVIALLGVLAPPFDSARGALQPDILQGEAYVTGNALMNVTAQVSQILGFALGGAVVALTSVRGALILDAATFLVSAGLLLQGVRHRGPAQSQRGTLLRDTLTGITLVFRTPDLRGLLLLSVLGSVALIGTEGLAAPVADDLGGGPLMAGLLTAAGPAGFLLASFAVLRLPSGRRLNLLPMLVMISCVPLLVTPLTGSPVLVAALWATAGAGSTVNLIAGPEFMQRCPREVRARAYGVAASCLWTSQGVGLLLAGVMAGFLTNRQSVAALAALTLVIAIPLMRTQGSTRIVRLVP